MHLDLLLTVLSVCGALLCVVGLVLLVAEENLEVGLFDVGRDFAGVIVLVYGILLWNASERARKYWPGARTMLLALTAMTVPAIVTLPLVVWTWVTLLGPRMRLFMDARHRGLDASEAAALAQGLPVPARDRPEVTARRRAAVRSNRKAALVIGALALAAWVGWAIIWAEGSKKAFRDEGIVFWIAAWGLTALEIFLAWLTVRLRRGRSTRLNAWVWSLLSPLAPKSARRAWMLVRDKRDGLA